ncbi:MAG TPA: formate/nitrite transporter family protein [Pseudosphingobacterium sp.]|nr:formate/nitrite transporter family protein [Pseudosphingobacterium sp.]
MDYNKPTVVAASMIQAGIDKINLSAGDLLVRGVLSGAILGFGTTLALTATAQTGLAIVGAALFPACFIIVVLMGLELVTGSFAVLPMAYFDKKIDFLAMLKNLLLVFVGNLLGGLLYACLFCISISQFGHEEKSAVAQLIVKIAEAKTIGYAQYGLDGIVSVFTKGVLCNWMVTTGVVLGMSSNSSTGKILAAWLPIFIFFGQGFEHAVVNMFVIPAGIILGADVSISNWWLFNQLPVTFGNLLGGVVFTAWALYYTFGKNKRVNTIISSSARKKSLQEQVVKLEVVEEC